MMDEIGTVMEVRANRTALVRCSKSSLCEHCASAENCGMGRDSGERVIEAGNRLGAEVGDRVQLSISTRTFLQSSFMVYIVPLIALVIGAVAGQLIGQQLPQGPDPNLLAAILGCAFLVGAFLVIRVGSRALPQEDYRPQITAILTPDEEAPERDDHGN